MSRDPVLRVAALALVLYGLFGLALVGLASALALRTLDELAAARAGLVLQRDGLVDVLRSTSGALAQTGQAFETFGSTLDEAERSAQHAADLARDSATTAQELAQASRLQIFGVEPLAGLAPGFRRAAEQLGQLGMDLRATAGALDRSQGGVGATALGLDETRRRLDALADAFASTPILGGSPDALWLFRIAVFGLLLWLAGQALISIALGLVLWRYVRGRAASLPTS